MLVNSILLKKPERIKVLGMVLIISLLIWRLIERTMRQNIKDSGKTITGWKKRRTDRPTSFMLTTRFKHILVITSGNFRKLARPLTHSQLEFLHALGLNMDIHSKMTVKKNMKMFKLECGMLVTCIYPDKK